MCLVRSFGITFRLFLKCNSRRRTRTVVVRHGTTRRREGTGAGCIENKGSSVWSRVASAGSFGQISETYRIRGKERVRLEDRKEEHK